MKALTWDRLTDIKNTVKPYRGTTNRFPVGDRRHNHKDFIAEERNGEQVYVIRYGYGWECKDDHTKEEWLVNQNTNQPNIHERTTNGVTTYESYRTIPRELGIVRSDNTFEFTHYNYGQGDNIMLSNWSRGYFCRSSRHGGMIYRANDIFHPIFKGMRVNCETMMPHKDSQYQVTGKRVSRKDAKEFLSRYTDFYQVNEVMLKTMEWKGYMETAVDVMKSLDLTTENWSLMQDEKDKLIKFADENLNTCPLDAGIAFALAYDVMNTYSRVRAFSGVSNSYYTQAVELDILFANMKRKLNKELYKRNPSVMKLTEYVPNQPYPPSEWGIDITVNGKEVEQL
jgi:hypothetical protein